MEGLEEFGGVSEAARFLGTNKFLRVMLEVKKIDAEGLGAGGGAAGIDSWTLVGLRMELERPINVSSSMFASLNTGFPHSNDSSLLDPSYSTL